MANELRGLASLGTLRKNLLEFEELVSPDSIKRHVTEERVSWWQADCGRLLNRQEN